MFNPLERPQLSDISIPVPKGDSNYPSISVTAVQQIYFYSPAEWEKFISEWAIGFSPDYEKVKLIGGSGDRGVDIAAFKTCKGFEGHWDCFQAKHYKKALIPSNAYPEMLKLFCAVFKGYYLLPDRYIFAAPKGCGTTLDRLLSKPMELREQFKKYVLELGPRDSLIQQDSALEYILNLVEDTDFSMFQSISLDEMLNIHRRTPYYVPRFGDSRLPDRPPNKLVPEIPEEVETVYVKKLIDIYREKAPDKCVDIKSIIEHTSYGKHFQRQRESFYAAESLRTYARDFVPERTFELLKEDIYTGIIEVYEEHHPDGYSRLSEVLKKSVDLNLDMHALISKSTLLDRKGICHQLANEDKLTWVNND